MSVKDVLKRVPGLKALNHMRYCVATMISPELNTKMHYKAAFGKKLDLENPQTLNEKILWLKLKKYMKDPLVIQCADKYRVREYVEQCGCGDILNELIGVYDKAEDIPWEELPQQFALKWNFGAGMNLICSDKEKLDKTVALQQFRDWGKCKYWLTHSEMQYKYIPKKIICETYLGGFEKAPPDYKVYCFHGKPKAILVMHDRGQEIKSEFFDCKWNQLKNTDKYCSPTRRTERPQCLEKMLEYAGELSQPFPFVRCDFYVIDSKLYFGELTFTPAGGISMSETQVEGKGMTEFLHLDLD